MSSCFTKPVSLMTVTAMGIMSKIISKICPTDIASISSLENPNLTSCSNSGVLAASQVSKVIETKGTSSNRFFLCPLSIRLRSPFRHITRNISKKAPDSSIASANEGIPSLSPIDTLLRGKRNGMLLTKTSPIKRCDKMPATYGKLFLFHNTRAMAMGTQRRRE